MKALCASFLGLFAGVLLASSGDAPGNPLAAGPRLFSFDATLAAYDSATRTAFLRPDKVIGQTIAITIVPGTPIFRNTFFTEDGIIVSQSLTRDSIAPQINDRASVWRPLFSKREIGAETLVISEEKAL